MSMFKRLQELGQEKKKCYDQIRALNDTVSQINKCINDLNDQAITQHAKYHKNEQYKTAQGIVVWIDLVTIEWTSDTQFIFRYRIEGNGYETATLPEYNLEKRMEAEEWVAVDTTAKSLPKTIVIKNVKHLKDTTYVAIMANRMLVFDAHTKFHSFYGFPDAKTPGSWYYLKLNPRGYAYRLCRSGQRRGRRSNTISTSVTIIRECKCKEDLAAFLI